MATSRELIEAVTARYHTGTRSEKKDILDEFTKVTGFHRKHAIRVLRKIRASPEIPKPPPSSRLYDEAAETALVILWEAADRMCGKRLKEAIPVLVEAMERHGHLKLDAEVRPRLLAMSAATMDRRLQHIREAGKQKRRRSRINTPLRNSIAVRTFAGWNDPAPGFFEMDYVAHCGTTTTGSYVHSLVLTDIASGWTEAAAMAMREQTLVTKTVDSIRRKLLFPILGLDVDNDSTFINETVLTYCRDRNIELTRCRPYKKNDQAWIEQKNGAVVRRMVGYGRLAGIGAATVLTKLHEAARLYVNFFQPSFKLKSKKREGAKVIKRYFTPATPYLRLLSNDRVSTESKEQLRWMFDGLDPVLLLNEIREAQRTLAQIELGAETKPSEVTSVGVQHFVKSLSTAWRDGEVRATHRKRPSARGPRTWRTRQDPFEKVQPLIEQWLNEKPDINAKDLFHLIQEHSSEQFQPGQLRTLQRQVKQWRSEIVRQLLLGSENESLNETVGIGPAIP
jgi:integrase-like protein